jgi:hypothetical protein
MVVRRRGSHIVIDNRLTVGGDGDPALPRRKIPGTHFYQRLSRPQDHSAKYELHL